MNGMHTLGGVIKEVVVKGVQGLRIAKASTRLRQAVADYNQNKGPNPGRADGAQLARIRAALQEVVRVTPAALTSRLQRLTGAGKAAKTHTYFLLAGPIGLYVITSARFPEPVQEAYLRLLQACGDLWQKVLEGGEVDALEQRVVEAVCLVELRLSVNEMDIKLHNLLHLVLLARHWHITRHLPPYPRL
ncbi:hypothetical protein VOLCADRAFT_101317 [Volvox carteri f. nagariensis]|uniref:Uncharacterized protein n=1 Tax=Volvox carteri f. nagariensis TaxID=3068 RepID=D8UMB0_VOLCA|nr:uncharacterized protein VOLCADRAFT_101317 [Volvox carteri f. nagariensis]EFJ39138.1 hypothetical protein VOLCADRAFT_101317 [Volvox carteri f. nagariensis]|eukprot:XP_002959796.1 hypothetical protein VOLCADRAFT_101317 [Volvox carteri f. nagariensis]